MDVQKVDITQKSLLNSFPSLQNKANAASPAASVAQIQPASIAKSTAQAPLAQPTKDTFVSENKTENSAWDTALKYSGIVALAGVAAVAIVKGKNSGNEISALKTKVTDISGKVDSLITDITKNSGSIKTVTESVSALSENIKQLTQDISKHSETIKGVENGIKGAEKGISDKISGALKAILAGIAGGGVIKLINDENKNVSKRKNPPMSDTNAIWGNLWLNGQFAPNATAELSPETIKVMKAEITKAVSGKSIVTPMDKKDVRMWSVSYETQFNNAGGQRDIAEQAPIAYSKAGINTYGIAPLFRAKLFDNSDERTFLDLGGGKYIYRTQCYKKGKVDIELEKVYDGKMANGAAIEVYEGIVDGQKYLFVTDDNYFNYNNVPLIGGTEKNATVFANLENTANYEQFRLAQFNNLVYEALAAAKEGKLKRKDGTTIEAPNKMVSHEAWQSGGLLAKLRLYSIAEEGDKSRAKETTEYMRTLADNTAIPIHNIGEGYQGRMKMYPNWEDHPRWRMKCYFDTLFDKYSSDIINNAFIENVKDKEGKDIPIFGTENQRIGFVGDVANPASMAVALAGKIGAVSEGYTQEIVNNGLAGSELQKLLKVKYDNGGLVSFPNGVDKNGLAATPDVVAKLNKDFGNKLKNILGDNADVTIRPYVQKFDDDKDKIDPIKFAKDKLHNKKLFVALLKHAALHNTEPSLLIDKGQAPNFVGTFNVADINENTPIFSMASRMDFQKGFDTAVEAYGKLMDMITVINNSGMGKKLEIPVMIISGGTKGEEADNEVAYLVNQVQQKYPDSRILWTRPRTSASGLQLMNMTTINTMPSDFEPYGISDLKGMYAGSHVLVTEVGGMRPSGTISRKIYPAEFAKDKDGNPDYTKVTNTDTANALTVKDYEYMCTYRDAGKGKDEIARVRSRNAQKLAQQMLAEMRLSPEDRTKMDINAQVLDVSWDKGATQNYLDILNIK